MAKFYLIGGHDFDTKSNYIAKRLIDLTNKINPTIVLIPLASKDSEKTINNFKKEYRGLNYTLKTLLLTKNPSYEEINACLNKADVLFFSGGSTAFLIDYLVSNKLDWILYDS